MKSKLGLTSILIGCLVLCACHSKNDLQVTSKNFDSEIEQQQNLVFLFNKDLYPDSLLGGWDSTAFIEFTPAVKGRFKWNSSSELVFSPGDGFSPCTEYSAVMSPQLLKHSRKKYGLPKEVMHFHTAPLRVMTSNVLWTRSKNQSDLAVQLDVSFNYEVNLDEAAKKLALTAAGNRINVSAVNKGPGKVLSLQFVPLTEKDEESEIKVALEKGVHLADPKFVSTGDTAFTKVIPSRYNLAVTDLAGVHTGTEGTITVTTSQPVMEKDLKNLITLFPVVPFDIAMNESGFTITSKDLQASQSYQVNISARLEGTLGGRMKNEYSESVAFGKLEPSIKFENEKGIYLSSAGFRNLALHIVNVPKVKVTVIKIYENNIEQFFGSGRSYYDDDENDKDRYSFARYRDVDNMGDTVFTQTYETSKLPRQNAARILHLDFKDKIKGYNGVYVLKVSADDDYWLREAKVLCLSDIGMIVKEEKDNLYVFANSIKNATALPGVKLSFIGTNNQRVYTAVTDGEGVVALKNIHTQWPGFKIALITATMNDEFSLIMLDKAKIGTSRYDVGGRQPNEAGLNAMLYPERNLYRPGETIHMTAVVRDEQWKTPGEIPVKIKLVMPNGRDFATMRKILNEQGSCETSFAMPPSTMTGTYTVNIMTGNDLVLNTYDISIEEFMPDRIKVSQRTDKEEYKQGDSVVVTGQANNLFGTAAAERNYECELNMSKMEFKAPKFDDYDFDFESDFSFTPVMRSGETDERGGLRESFGLSNDLANSGMLKANITTTVFDENGRPVHRYAHINVYTQPLFVGIKEGDDYVSTKQPMRIDIVAVDKKGDAQQANVKVVVLRKEYHSVIEAGSSSYRYVSKSEDRVLSDQTIRLAAGATPFMINPKESGEYEVRVFADGSDHYVKRTFYAYGWSNTQYNSFEVNNEGNVEIKLSKPAYQVGEDINLLFTTPFDGRMLVTLERDKVLKYYYLDVKNKSASLTVRASDLHLPNVFVAATLFRPMNGSEMPLTVAHGYESVPVENKNNILPVQITVPEKSRSKTKQTINIKTSPGAFVTIAAVDEGILQIKNFHTPQPYEYFYQKVALSVNSYDIYPWLLPEIKTTLSSTGGDGGDYSGMRVNPFFVNRVKNVSFWSGILEADGSGNVRYTIDIPEFSGDLRVMAVAYKNNAFGHTDKHMKVCDPMVISTGLPRFMSPKDEVTMPVSISNTTNKEATAIVTTKVTGPLTVTSTQTVTLKIPANREQRAVFNIAAQPMTGKAKVTVSVKAFNETFSNETELSVRPAASLQKVTGSGVAAENNSTFLDLKNNFIPATVSGKLVLGKSPLTMFSKNIDDLVRYPYGCVEQTTSAAFPQLYFTDLVKSINKNADKDLNPGYNVQQAINKLQSMQQSDGGLSYWPEGGEESWWGSVYACHFLVEAKKAGFDVNKNTIDRLQFYMCYKLEKKETEVFRFNGGKTKTIVPEEVPYSLYILAANGMPQQGTMNYYKAHRELLTLDGRYLLAAAYALSGQPGPSKEILPPAFSDEIPDHAFGGSFYSRIRDEALSLNVLMDIDPKNVQVGIMARQVSEQLRTERYLNTQENAFCMLALGKVARMANKTTSTAAVAVNGKTVANSKGETMSLDMKAYSGTKPNIKVSGSGGFYYFWEMAGISADGSIKEEDSYLRVRRTFYDRSGHEITGRTFHQNDLIVIRLSIETQYEATVENIAITDMLPAGFEIENGRLTEMPDMTWVKDESQPQFRDIRDDRINMFTTANRKPKYMYYMVRAVCPGTYQLGPVQADAMYDGSYHSYNGSGVVKILDK